MSPRAPVNFLKSPLPITLFIIILFSVLSPFSLIHSKAFAATHYVDATNGNDINNGLSPSSPWKTIAKVNSSKFNPGDQILFKRGEIWRETLVPPSSGTSGHPIMFAAYGSGAKPIISGANILASWTSESVTVGRNMIINPNKFAGVDLPDWDAATATTVLNNVASPLAPDGTQTASSLVASTANTGHNVHERISATAGQSYVYSLFAQKKYGADYTGGAWIVMKVVFLDSRYSYIGEASCLFDAMTGNIGTSNRAGNITVSRRYNDWFRFSFSYTAPAGVSSIIMMICLADKDGRDSFIGPASLPVHVYLWGTKHETGALPTPIATYTGYYTSSVSTPPKVAFENGVPYIQSKDKNLFPGQFWHDVTNSRLYIRITADNTPIGYTIEAGQRDNGIYNDNSADYITVDGLELYGANSANLLSSQNDGWVVQYCNIWGSGYWNVLIRGNPGGAGSATGCVVQDNTIGFIARDSATGDGSGINLGGLAGPIVQRNKVATTNGVGIYVNTGDTIGGGAAGTNAIINYNILTNNDINIISNSVSGSSTSYNLIYNSHGFGISHSSSPNFQAHYNVIYNLTAPSNNSTMMWNGIDINTNSTGGTVYNNTIVGVVGNNITVETGSTGCIIKNNILDASLNSPAPSVLWASPIYVDPTVSKANIRLSNNDLVPRRGGIVGNWQNVDKNLADWIMASGETNSIASNPLFVSTSTPDFHLQSTSLCINAGVDVGLIQDFQGLKVPVGSAPVIGAYEYQPVSSLAAPKGLKVFTP